MKPKPLNFDDISKEMKKTDSVSDMKFFTKQNNLSTLQASKKGVKEESNLVIKDETQQESMQPLKNEIKIVSKDETKEVSKKPIRQLKVINTRIYEDQHMQLMEMSFNKKKEGEKLTIEEMIRDALEVYLKKTCPK